MRRPTSVNKIYLIIPFCAAVFMSILSALLDLSAAAVAAGAAFGVAFAFWNRNRRAAEVKTPPAD